MNSEAPGNSGRFVLASPDRPGLAKGGQTKYKTMQDLIERLMAQGLTEQQAYKAVEVIKDFAKEKFPIFGGAIDKLFDKYSPKNDDDFMP